MLSRLILTKTLNLGSSLDWVLHALLSLFLGTLFCRGLGEILLSKPLAMMIQFLFVIAIAAVLFFMNKDYHFTDRHRWILYLGAPFAFVASFSCFLTLLGGFLYGGFYWAFNISLVLLAFLFNRISSGRILPLRWHRQFIFWGWVLLMVALQDQLGGKRMPGYSVALIPRPASLTGSFLHYPLLMSLLSLLCLQWAVLERRLLYGFSALIFALSVVTVFSRSGVFVIGFAMLLLFGMSLLTAKRSALIGGGIGLVLVFTVIALGMSEGNSFPAKASKRIISAVDTGSKGNSGRVLAWMRGIAIWSDSNLLIGEHTGEVTNMTGKLVVGPKVGIVESGPIQQLANFGLLGMLSFYGLLFALYPMILPQHRILRASFIAALCQTSFYQSIEVVPYITLLVLFPAISEAFDFYCFRGVKTKLSTSNRPSHGSLPA